MDGPFFIVSLHITMSFSYMQRRPAGHAAKQERKKTILCRPNGGPKQLRSAEYPSGLPHLEGIELEQVQLANALYNGLQTF